MKRIFIISFAVLILAACNQDQGTSTESSEAITNSQESGAAKIDFKKSTYEFGKIVEGEKVSYDFVFTNNGVAPLIIKDATASCGCTVPEIPSDPIAPGATGKIKVVFNSAGKNGLQDKVVTVTANTIPSQTLLHLIGEVVK